MSRPLARLRVIFLEYCIGRTMAKYLQQEKGSVRAIASISICRGEHANKDTIKMGTHYLMAIFGERVI